jgi:type 1 glutamine amidotransferase
MVLLDNRKDHGPAGNGVHDYPLWRERWALLLGGRAASAATQVNLYGPPVKNVESVKGAGNVLVECVRGWPSDAQFASADVIVAYGYLAWTDARTKQVADYQDRGGGLVLIHSATWTKPKADPDVAALVGIGGFTRYRHGEVTVELVAANHPICRGLPPRLLLNDEAYWPPTPPPDASRVTVLATSREKARGKNGREQPQPLFWTYQVGRGRVFGCVPGHFAWTFDDPWFRLWLLRGIAWAAGRSPYRFDELALRGARVGAKK